MAVREVKVWYLQMFAHNGRTVMPPRAGLDVKHVPTPTVEFYRHLYDRVGNAYEWYTRARMPDAQLQAILNDPGNEMHVLHVGGKSAGFAEFDRRVPDEVELVQFGLTPEYIGQGLGKYFLQWAIDKAWSYQPKRFWLHTCELDHPRALPNYLAAGFQQYDQRIQRREG